MKTIITMLATIFFTFAAFAADYTYSNHEPQIQRLQGVVLYPYEIEEISITDDSGKDRIGYRYKLLRLTDTGQTIYQNRTQFATENRAAIAEQLYDISDLIEATKSDELDTKMTEKITAEPIKLEVKQATK